MASRVATLTASPRRAARSAPAAPRTIDGASRAGWRGDGSIPHPGPLNAASGRGMSRSGPVMIERVARSIDERRSTPARAERANAEGSTRPRGPGDAGLDALREAYARSMLIHARPDP